MKKLSFLALVAGISMVITSCDRTAGARYIDLSTGREVELVKDDKNGLMVDKATRQPVYIYVDTRNNDTIYGSTGEVINGRLVMNEGKYYYENDADVKFKDGKYKNDAADYKLKTEDDG